MIKAKVFVYFFFAGGLFPLPRPEGLPVLEGQFGLFAIVFLGF